MNCNDFRNNFKNNYAKSSGKIYKKISAISISILIAGTNIAGSQSANIGLKGSSAFGNLEVAFAAVTSEGRLYNDGTEVVYDFHNPKPMFIDGNAYVPIRATADYLGMNFSYNPSTLTMTFSKAGVNTSYTLNQNELFVNGQEIYFSTPAVILDGTTYMSVDMFATAINAEVVQDFNTRTIHIYSNPANNVVSTASKPLILGVNAEKYLTNYRETINLSIMTTTATKSVRLLDYNGQVVAQSTDYVTIDNNRKFVLKYSPDLNFSSELLYYIHPGDGGNYYPENGKNIKFNETIFINPEYAILSMTSNDKYLDNGDSTYIYVYTEDSVERVKLTNDKDSEVLTSSSYYTNSSGVRYFRFLVTKNNNHDVNYTATTGSTTQYTSNVEDLIIYDDSSYTYNSQTNTYGDLYEINVQYNSVPVNTYVEVEVVTDEDIELVQIKNNKYETIATIYLNSADVYSTYAVWTKNILIDTSGEQKYYIYVYRDSDDLNDFDRGNFTIYGGEYYY